MKMNWGTGIVIGMVSFMAFILYFVVTMSTQNEYAHDLVTEDYYRKEVVYQQEIDAETNTYKLREKITGQKVPEGWLLTFPKELATANIKGKVFLYRPSNQQLDFDFPIVLSGTNLLIPDKNLVGGRWNITVAWEYHGNPYLYKTAITY